MWGVRAALACGASEAGGGRRGQVATAALLGMGVDDVPDAARALAHHLMPALSPYRPPASGGGDDGPGGSMAPEPWSAYLGVHLLATRPWPGEA